MNNGFASVYCYYWSPLGDSLSEPYSSDQCTHACVNDYLSARARGEYCSCRPCSPAGFRAGELKQPLVSAGQGTRCWHWQSHRSKERMCCCLKYRLLQLQRSPSQGCVIVIFFFFAWCATLDVNWLVCIFSSWFLFAVNHICTNLTY